MKVVLTGAAGFLGWHTRLRLHALTDYNVIPVTRPTWSQLRRTLEGTDVILHIAGVNRGTDDEVERGNIQLAEELALALLETPAPPRVVFANSIRAGDGTPYGRGKAAASSILREAAHVCGSQFIDVQLPNIFGAHGRPRYNSFVATFIDAVITGTTPTISDGHVDLLSAQEAAASLAQATSTINGDLRPAGTGHTVRSVWGLLQEIHTAYSYDGEIPNLSTEFRLDLFNAYRAALFPSHYPITLKPHIDRRGTFIETARIQGGEGQASVSSTAPGETRGEHYHLRKVERFAVVAGQARISLRKMFTDETVHFDVDGASPVAIDMPIGWTHNILNIGRDTLYTQFWANERYRPDAPDTFPEPVTSSSNGGGAK